MLGMLLWRAVQMIAVMFTVTMLSTALLSSEDVQEGLTSRKCDGSEMVSLKFRQPSTTTHNTIPPRATPSDLCCLRSRYINMTVHHDTRPLETRYDTVRLADYFSASNRTKRAGGFDTFTHAIKSQAWYPWMTLYREAISGVLTVKLELDVETDQVQQDTFRHGKSTVPDSTSQLLGADSIGVDAQLTQHDGWIQQADKLLASSSNSVTHQAWFSWLVIYRGAITRMLFMPTMQKDIRVTSNQWDQYVIPKIRVPSTGWCGVIFALASICIHIWQARCNYRLQQRLLKLGGTLGQGGYGHTLSRSSDGVISLSVVAGPGVTPIRRSLKQQVKRWLKHSNWKQASVPSCLSGVNWGMHLVSFVQSPEWRSKVDNTALVTSGFHHGAVAANPQMMFAHFLEVYLQAAPGVASPVCVVTGHGAKQSMTAEAITVSPRANTTLASCHTDWMLNMGPAIEAIISNDIYWRLYGVCVHDMQKVYLVKRTVFTQRLAFGDLASHVAIEEEDQYSPANLGQAEQTAEPLSKPAAEDSLGLCLLAIHAVLPLLVGQGYQLRACMEVNEYNDPQWILNAATAELHCLQAEDLYEFKMSGKALNLMGKVLEGLHFPASLLTARASAFAHRVGMHEGLNQPIEAVQDYVEVLKVEPHHNGFLYVMKQLVNWGQHDLARRLAELVQASFCASGLQCPWTDTIVAHQATMESVEELVRGGAVKDFEEGELILGRISNMWPHGSHHLLANLKAEQERYTKGPTDVLKTLEPYLSGSEQCCWALNKALWAHWILGDVSQLVATLRALEVAPSTLTDNLVGYVKLGSTVLGDLLAKFARLEEDWTVIDWALDTGEMDLGKRLLFGLRKDPPVTRTPAMCAQELLLWAKLHRLQALRAEQLSQLSDDESRQLSPDKQAEKLSQLQLRAGQEHVLCLGACDWALGLMPDCPKIYIKACNIKRQSLEALFAKQHLAGLAREVLQRLDKDELEAQQWRGALYWSGTRNGWSSKEETDEYRGGNWYHLLGVEWASQDKSVINKAKRKLMFLCVPDKAKILHPFLDFTTDPMLEGVGSAQDAFSEASKALPQCSGVKDLIGTAADTILHPIQRPQAIASIMLDLSQDPQKAPAAYQEYCAINSEKDAEALCTWVQDQLQLPDAKKAQADIDAKAQAAAEVQRQADAEAKESERLRKAWNKAYNTYVKYTNAYPADEMSFGFCSRLDAVDMARRAYNTFHGIVDEQDQQGSADSDEQDQHSSAESDDQSQDSGDDSVVQADSGGK